MKAFKQQNLIEVTYVESGNTVVLTAREFFRLFGEDEGAEILNGYAPHIVAVVVGKVAA